MTRDVPICEQASLLLQQDITFFSFIPCKHATDLTWLIARIGLSLPYSQHQTVFLQCLWEIPQPLWHTILSQNSWGTVLRKPHQWASSVLEAKGLVSILAKSNHRSQKELQWQNIPLPTPQPNSALYLWVKPLHVCTHSAFLPPHVTPAHPAETQIMWFAGTSSSSSKILWSYHEKPGLYSHSSHPGLFKLGIYLIFYSGILIFKKLFIEVI